MSEHALGHSLDASTSELGSGVFCSRVQKRAWSYTQADAVKPSGLWRCVRECEGWFAFALRSGRCLCSWCSWCCDVVYRLWSVRL
jgi:hypothetical protein